MKKKILIIIIVLVMVLGIGSTFAYLRSDAGSQTNSRITLTDFHVDLISDISSIKMVKTYPMTDTEGLSKTDNIVTFAIKNNGGIIANYKVSLVDKETVSTLINKDVRYRLKITKGESATEILDVKNLDDAGLIDEGTIDVGETISYELIMWQDFNSSANGAVFSKSILVEGMQVASLDKSGANYPELLDNMIPVYYDETNSVWRKADSRNLDNDYKWFDYDSGMWANAATVFTGSAATTLTLGDNTTTQCSGEACTREDYINAEKGTVIPMDDISSMFVWIPRYKYVIFNGNNGTLTEQMINVTFEHGIGKTGTVTCSDQISGSSSSTSQSCSTITNGQSSYTHPAFTFGSEELTGFWIGKFESSTDDATCNETVNATNCNKAGLNILVKPLNKSLRYISLYNLFINTRNMEIYNNIHGFVQDENALTTSSSGDIENDNNILDTHVIKNMEWGAVAYLSQSKYGKYGKKDSNSNELYTGLYKEIYINNHNGYMTGYSGGAYNSSSSATNTYPYNDLTDLGSGKGYRGAGASSTGDIYGVYDLSGGVGEYTMGNMVNSSGLFQVGSATTWTTTVYPNEKYYDKYSYYGSNQSTSASIGRGKLGDATKEVIKGWTTSGHWNGDYNYFPYSSYSWFVRGGYMSGTTNAGVFASSSQISGTSNQYYGSRVVLTVSREMPWLNN